MTTNLTGKFIMIKNPLLGKHSHNNRESKEGQILRFIREARKLSLKDVASKLNMKSLEVDHYENGRKFYSPESIDLFLKCYEFKKADFNSLMDLKILNKQLVNHFLTKTSLASN
jgi:transcriptional regulator with XRE-family HTH domain